MENYAVKMEETRNFVCQDCGKTFDRKFCLKRHESSVHMKEVWRARDSPSITRNNFLCKKCNRSFANDSNLRRHQRASHIHKEPRVFICDICSKSCLSRTEFEEHWSKTHSLKVISLHRCPICKTDVKTCDILNHFEQTHNIKTEVHEYSFPDEDSFMAWKRETELKTYSRFIKSRSSRRKSPITKFTCHRSGFFRSKSTGYRRLKTQGSKKIDGHCPASIRVEKHSTGLRVKFTSTHIHPGSGKENEIRHLSISATKKEEIARKLMDEIPKAAIIEDIRSSYEGMNLQLERTINAQDVANVSAKLEVSSEIGSGIRRQRVTVTKKAIRRCFLRIFNRVKTAAGRSLFLKELEETGKKIDILEKRSLVSV